MYLVDAYKNPHAGTESQLYNLVANMDRSRYVPELTVLRNSEYLEANNFPCEFTVLPVKRMLSPVSICRIAVFAIMLRTKGTRLVHIFFNDASIIGPVILRLFGIKVIISRRDMGFWYNRMNLALLRINSLFINAAVANCHAVKTLTHEKEYISLKKIHVIYNGYRTDSRQESGDDNPAGQVMEFLKNNRTIGIVANIRPIKRISDLINAFFFVSRKHSDTHLVVIGGGDATELKKLSDELALSQKIHFLGARNDVDKLIQYLDVAVLCSESEGFSNALVEYMFSRVPVVCTDTGGNPELVIDGETGYLVKIGDIHQLADRIDSILSGKVDTEQMTANAYKHVTRLCNFDSMLSQHYKLYDSVLGK